MCFKCNMIKKIIKKRKYNKKIENMANGQKNKMLNIILKLFES